MKMTYFMILFGLAFSLPGWGQKLTPSVIAAEGGRARSATMTLDWTLGEYAVETLPYAGGLYTQGFHQPILTVHRFYVGNEELISDYAVAVAPNPVQAMLRVTIDAPTDEKVQVSLIDLLGRSRMTKETSGQGVLQLDLSTYIPGVYLLTVKKLSGELIRTFKIIKGNKTL